MPLLSKFVNLCAIVLLGCAAIANHALADELVSLLVGSIRAGLAPRELPFFAAAPSAATPTSPATLRRGKGSFFKTDGDQMPLQRGC